MIPELILLSSLATLTGGALATRDYLARRFEGPEDRYMALYGATQWDASNMTLSLRFDPRDGAEIEAALLSRLSTLLRGARDTLFHETAAPGTDELTFCTTPEARIEELLSPRRGVYLDLCAPDQIDVIWNHMQTDGVGMWAALKPLFDENPTLTTYREVPRPPPLLPELLSLPRVLRQARRSGQLVRGDVKSLTRAFDVLDATRVKQLKDKLRAPFNLTSSALAIDAVFRQRADASALMVALTVYYPFIEGRNRYGVLPVKIRRGGVSSIVAQLERQCRRPLLAWGASSTLAYVMGRVPDATFTALMGKVRGKFDVMISNLPVGANPIELAGRRVQVSCHPWELTIPYYFLIVGTRHELHVSSTSHYEPSGPLISDAHVDAALAS